MSEIVYLAHEIEWYRAIEKARLKWPARAGRRCGTRWKQAVASEFDPHAATELAALIQHRLRRSLAREGAALAPSPADQGPSQDSSTIPSSPQEANATAAFPEKLLEDVASYLENLSDNHLRNDVDMLLDECEDPRAVAERLRSALADVRGGLDDEHSPFG